MNVISWRQPDEGHGSLGNVVYVLAAYSVLSSNVKRWIQFLPNMCVTQIESERKVHKKPEKTSSNLSRKRYPTPSCLPIRSVEGA